MSKVIDITANEPHKSSEVICVKCFRRWYAVRHADSYLADLECTMCGPGYVIETGEQMRERENPKRNMMHDSIVTVAYKFDNGMVSVFGFDDMQIAELQGPWSLELERKIRARSIMITEMKGF